MHGDNMDGMSAPSTVGRMPAPPLPGRKNTPRKKRKGFFEDWELDKDFFRPTGGVTKLGNGNYLVLLKAKKAWEDLNNPETVHFGNLLLSKRNICGSWVTDTYIYITYLTDYLTPPEYFKEKHLLADELPEEAIPVWINVIFSWKVDITP